MSLRANWSGYREMRPGSVLGDFVSAAWVRSAGGDRQDGADFREICDGRINLICRTGSPARIFGPMTSPRSDWLGPGEVIVGLRLRLGAASVLGLPAYQLANRSVDAGELFGATLRDRLAEAAPAAAVGLMSDALLRRSQLVEADQMIAEAVTKLATESEVSAVWRSMGISERSFRRRFVAGVGIGPKKLQTLLRFQRLLGRAQRAVAAGRPVAENGLAALAYQSGYSDQPHLTRECLRITGSNLGDYLGELQRCCGDHQHGAQLTG